MPEAETRKIAPHHLEREACLYVRQSSLRQVVQNTESGRRQYGLSRKAMALGWPAECVRVIDEDQGKSGAYSENRSGFRDLMARIAAGEVGIVLGLEVSRLARDNADWHQLLRLPGITGTSTSAGKSWSATDGKSARACAAITSTPGYPAS